jgi:hypothetical protein
MNADPRDDECLDESELTPMPGKRLESVRMQKVHTAFLAAFRHEPNDIPTQVPTNACFEDARLVDETILDRPWLCEDRRVLVMQEGGIMGRACAPQDIYETSVREARQFLAKRHPWEDYDLYIFDDSLEWCVSISHHGEVIVVDPGGILST